MHLFCGCSETLGDGTPALKLATNRPLVYVRDSLPAHGKDEIFSWIRLAYQRIGEVCDWKGERIHNLNDAPAGRIVHLITVADLGNGGVLADQMMPYAGGNVLAMRINTRVHWQATDGQMQQGTVDPIRTLCHESLHFAGLSHFPAGDPPELMEPSISQTVIRPQPTEIRVLVGWFGQPGPTTDRPPPIPNAGAVDEFVKKIVIPGYKIARAA